MIIEVKSTSNYRNWKGYEGISGSQICVLKLRARYRKLDFDLDAKYLWDLFVSQKGRCALSDVKIFLSKKATSTSPKTASLDGIDSNKGYIKGNVQWIHKLVNKMKSNINLQQFIKWCLLIAIHNKESIPF